MKGIRKFADSKIILSSVAIFSCITQNTNATEAATKQLDNIYEVIIKNDQVSEYIKEIKGKNNIKLYGKAIAAYEGPQAKRTIDNMEKFIVQCIKDRNKFSDDNGAAENPKPYTPIDKAIETAFKKEKYAKLEDIQTALQSNVFDVLRLKPIKLKRDAYMNLSESIYIPADIDEYAALQNETTKEIKPATEELAKLTMQDLQNDDFKIKEGLISIELPSDTINKIKDKYKMEPCKKSSIKDKLNEYLSAIVLGSDEHKAIVSMNDKTKYDESEYKNMNKLHVNIKPEELVPENIKEKYKEQEITNEDLKQYPTIQELMGAASKAHKEKIPYKATKSLSTIYNDADIEEVVTNLKKENEGLNTKLKTAQDEATKNKTEKNEEKQRYDEINKKYTARIEDEKKARNKATNILKRKFAADASMTKVMQDILNDYATMEEQWNEATKGESLKESGEIATLKTELDALRKEKERLESENKTLQDKITSLGSGGDKEIALEDKQFIKWMRDRMDVKDRKEVNARWTWMTDKTISAINAPKKGA